MPRLCSSLLLSLLITSSASAVTIDWVPIGDPGNPGDPQPSCQYCGPGTTFGSVPYTYQIAKFEVTNAQYAPFLNAVASAGYTDTYGLYHTNMGNPAAASNGMGGIARSVGSSGYVYTTIAGRENMPVNWVSLWDAMRFANWMQNGQPTGTQGAGTTETGAYTITQAGLNDNSITRNPGATIALTTENEWYKAAYYDSSTHTYFDYSTSSNAAPICTQPTATPNRANCYNYDDYYQNVGGFTPVGSYTGSGSPSGTFDQAGNVAEWTESIIADSSGTARVLRGSWHDGSNYWDDASHRAFGNPWVESRIVGIRLGMVPEPSTGLLVIAGLLGFGGWRRAIP